MLPDEVNDLPASEEEAPLPIRLLHEAVVNAVIGEAPRSSPVVWEELLDLRLSFEDEEELQDFAANLLLLDRVDRVDRGVDSE